ARATPPTGYRSPSPTGRRCRCASTPPSPSWVYSPPGRTATVTTTAERGDVLAPVAGTGRLSTGRRRRGTPPARTPRHTRRPAGPAPPAGHRHPAAGRR